MKTFTFATIALAATCCVTYAQQQQQQNDGKLRAIVQFDKRSKPQLVAIDTADGNKFTFTTQNGQMAGDASKCLVFVIQTPAELAEGQKLYSAKKYKEARKKLAACKTKYAAYATLPHNPVRQAALLEIHCAVAMLDWPGVKSLAASFPSKNMNKDMVSDVVTVHAAKLLGRITDNMTAEEGAALAKDADALLANKSIKGVDGKIYGWIKYAKARGLAAGIPEDQIRNRSITPENSKRASQAIDAYCEAAVSSHGADPEIALDALIRAQAILWAMPGVKAYADAHPGKMDEKTWKAAPADFQDAVSIAYMILNIYSPGLKDERLEKAASFFYNAQAKPAE